MTRDNSDSESDFGRANISIDVLTERLFEGSVRDMVKPMS